MQDKLILPQINISSSKWNITSELILIAGGRKPSADWFSTVKMNRRIFCVDHGVDFCKENDIVPEILIGDLDSATGDSIKWALDNSVKIERHPVDKDFTDTQLALNHINDNAFAIITGAFGGRLDHLYSILFTCANSSIKNCLCDEHETVLFVNAGESLSIEFKIKPIALSLMPMIEICQGVKIDGVHWSLNCAELRQSLPNAISNRIESNTVNISLKEGKLAVYLCFVER